MLAEATKDQLQDLQLMESIDINYLILANEDAQDGQGELQAQKVRHRQFLQDLLSKPIKQLPYSCDKNSVQIARQHKICDLPTVCKFVHVLVTIIRSHIDHRNSVKAVHALSLYIKNDKVLKQNFRPNFQLMQGLNLR